MAAEEHGIPAAEFVRNAAMGLAGDKPDTESAAISAGIVELLEQTHHGVYITFGIQMGRNDPRRTGQ